MTKPPIYSVILMNIYSILGSVLDIRVNKDGNKRRMLSFLSSMYWGIQKNKTIDSLKKKYLHFYHRCCHLDLDTIVINVY